MNKHQLAFSVPIQHTYALGMTKREYAAIHILAGLVAGYNGLSKEDDRFIPASDNKLLAQSAAQLADALFYELDRTNKI